MVKAIVGANWGDEGKGKMTDLLAADSDLVVRYQGGANAGHTIINDNGKFALHLLPSGVFYEHVVNVIAHGVALDLEKFFREYDALGAAGIHPKLLVSDRAQILMPYHVEQDRLEEQRLGDKSFGSTQSGIAPFYADKYLKIGFQVCELFEPERLWARLVDVCATKSLIFSSVYGRPALDPKPLYESLLRDAERLRPLVADTAHALNEAISAGKTVLMEGQLGALRDPDHGIYPFTTSSSPLAAYSAVSAGISPCAISNVITVVKAYSSCVGAGAFVTELSGDEAQELRERGGDSGEYGATTGRPRRVGWLDLVATRYGCMVQGTTDVALTVIDALGYLDRIPVCVAYRIDGELVTDFPPTPKLDRAQPVFETLDGWRCDIKGITDYERLPVNARRYIEFIEKRLGSPITYVSTG
ncbi:MAG: adenylosuccinate synthase, partial [Oscillospiraceae bacterium]